MAVVMVVFADAVTRFVESEYHFLTRMLHNKPRDFQPFLTRIKVNSGIL